MLEAVDYVWRASSHTGEVLPCQRIADVPVGQQRDERQLSQCIDVRERSALLRRSPGTSDREKRGVELDWPQPVRSPISIHQPSERFLPDARDEDRFACIAKVRGGAGRHVKGAPRDAGQIVESGRSVPAGRAERNLVIAGGGKKRKEGDCQ